MLAGAFVLAALVTPAALVSPGAPLARGSVVTARRNPRAAASSTDDDPRAVESSKPIPLTILSGFLGVGKTTVLSHLLSNKEGARIGVIVNDVAAVNIDAKLVATGGSDARDGGSVGSGDASSPWADDMVQLSNGCACCNAGDDLFGALSELISVSFMRNAPYDHIVVEASGVAEPKLMRQMFQEAAALGWPLMRLTQLASMVTVVDAGGFSEMYRCSDRLKERPELETDAAAPIGEGGSAIGDTGVVQLLVEQVETADVLVLNKIDRVSAREQSDVEQTLSAINGFASVIAAKDGIVPIDQILVGSREAGVSMSNEVMDHKSAVDLAKWLQSKEVKGAAEEDAHDHHDHASSDEHSHAADCNDPDCNDPTHDHSHGHEHSHTHEHSHAADCDDPDCTDPSHDHSHDRGETTAAKRFGIRTFVYSRRAPFDAKKISALLGELPFIPTVNTQAVDAKAAGVARGTRSAGGRSTSDGPAVDPFEPVLRSKGFMWLEKQPGIAFFWSQAGSRRVSRRIE